MIDKNIQNCEIKNIIFDVGNVLIDFCWQDTCHMLGFSDDIIQSFEKNMILTDIWDRLDEGTISQQDAIAKFIEAMPQYEAEVLKFWDHAQTFVREYDYSADMIRNLKNKGYKVYLLSNYPLDMYKLHWHTFRFFELVDGYIVSAAEMMRKPDERIYHLICERYNLNPSECIFFDDRQINVDAAIGVGMQSLLFESKETVTNWLEEEKNGIVS